MLESFAFLPLSIVTALNDRTNFIFFIVILSLFLVGIVSCFTSRFTNFKEFIPSLCSSIGVFGTFYGIFDGLSEFDTNHISESIPQLLDGMKIAFFTSLSGMFFSLILKSIYNINEDKHNKINDDTTLLQEINEQSHVISSRIESMNESLISLFSSRDSDNSLVNQVTLIRAEIRDNHEKTQHILQEMLNNFAEMVSENLVKQLTSVVDKFNAMLNDLVAESFNRLRESTDNLNNWQNEYKEQVLTNENNLKLIIASMNNLEQTYDKISKNLDVIEANISKINITTDELGKNTETLHSESELLKNTIEQIIRIGENAKNVIPTIEEKISNMIGNINEIEIKSKEFVTDTSNFMRSSSELLTKSSEEMSNIVSNTTRSIDEIITKHIQSTQEGLQDSLTKSLTTFAGSLSELSRRFAQDYMPLTDRLRRILEIAEKINK